ncbi:Ankyrin repeat-containing domain protein [Penicillium malachiteum]|uniref:Ankyrin repeat-containing domain protein n=1 Tax=Penicillium malachiteum TaxID=1324776 RepID=A0AAD6HCX3_9EURO|nr:Ankyrin repeat-containing domain protein [Penicillium malachiteum]
MSGLGVAAAAGSDDMVKMILSHSHLTRTAIADVARGGHMSTLKILLQDGRLDVNQLDKIGWTALHYAVYYGMLDMLQLLLSVERVYPDVRSDDQLGANHMPFSEAARRGDIKMMRILLRKGKVNVHYVTWSSWTPLYHAADAGSVKGVCYLLAQGVQVDQHDERFPTPFTLAAQGGHLDILRVLHSMGKVDMESLGEHERTPLSYTAEGGNPEAVAFLLAQGTKPIPKIPKAELPYHMPLSSATVLW